MPFIPALVGFLAANAVPIGAAASIAGAGTSIGEAIANSGGHPNAPTPQTPGPTPPNTQQLAQQRALVSQQLPNLVSATGGTASPEYDALMAQILSGVIGQPGAAQSAGQAVGQNFTPANSQPTNAAVSGGNVNLSDFLNSFSS